MIRKIKNVLLDLWYRIRLPAYRRLRRSLLFDPDFYLAENPDVAASGVPPLFHYLTTGHRECREPCRFFHSKYYTKQLSPGEIQGQPPLLHYLTKGWKDGINPNPFFDHGYYVSKIPDIDFTRTNPLVHFLQVKNSNKQHSPSPYFNLDFYTTQMPSSSGVKDDMVSCYSHYLETGAALNKAPSLYFDTEWYLDKTPVLREQELNPVTHYFMYGLDEKKSPSPLFDPGFYSATYGVNVTDLFAHYCSHGMKRDHRPCEWFDPVFYRQTYLHSNVHLQAPLHHFLQEGLNKGLYPNREIEQLIQKPVFSILVPVYNAEIAQLNNCIRSVLYQSYPHWELCLAEDCSTSPEIRPLLKQWAGKDDRIKVTFLEQNSGISAATNSAAALATGDYFGLLDNDDELSLNALFAVAQTINGSGGDLFYSDEDLIGTDGRQYSVFRKPAFNDELLLCHNYVTHFVVTKRSLFIEAGGCNSSLDGAQDLDLFLKLSEQAEKVVHIPQILYHWRASKTSTSINHEQKDYANEAGRKSIENALERRGIHGEAQFTELKYYYRTKRSASKDLSVTVVVNWNRPGNDLSPWLSSLLATAGHPVQNIILVLTDNSLEGIVQQIAAETGVSIQCRIISEEESFPHGCNLILDRVDSDFLAFVSGNAIFLEGNWLQALLEYAQGDDSGMVGGRVQHTSGSIQKIEPIPDYAQSSAKYYADYLSNCSVLLNGLHCPQQVQSVNIALCMVQTKLLRTVSAFNADEFPLLFSAHDLCYRFIQRGKKNIYTPYSQTTLIDSAVEPQGGEQALVNEKKRFQRKWHQFLAQGDPSFSSALLSDNGLSPDIHRSWLAGDQEFMLDSKQAK